MLELIIKKEQTQKQIALIENGNLVEYYEEDNELERKEGDIYIGIVKDIVKGMQAAFVDIGAEKNSFIHFKDLLPKVDESKQKEKVKKQTLLETPIHIEELVKPNQKILAQVKKDSNEKKGARISTHINLPSKYIVLMPNTDIITISQKIEDKKEQERLISLVKENLTPGNGAIIRTSAEHKTKEVIENIEKKKKKWNNILKISVDPKQNEPKLLYKSEDIVGKMLIDLADKELKTITTNDKKEKERLEALKKENKEYQKIEIILQTQKDLLEQYHLYEQIEKMQNRKIWLKCGGFITIDKTEALTAIDVNTGKYTGKSDLQQTVYLVNKEATIEVAKQIRLRDIGGIIIIDYIDMPNNENKEKIEALLKEELKKDRTKTQVEGFTKLDLMEMTRKHICSHKES